MIVVKTIGVVTLILVWISLFINLDKNTDTIKINSKHPWPLIFLAIGTICTIISSF